ncbi:hypothetical protein PTKIN_Ptkin09bG0171600 [Pterospermum kingtungense]
MGVKVIPDEVQRKTAGLVVDPAAQQVPYVNTDPRFNRKDGSLFPKKKRSVKKMMVESLINSFSTLYQPPTN